MRVAIIGAGEIGSQIAEGIGEGKAGKTQLVAIYDRHLDRAAKVARRLGIRAAHSVSDLTKDRSIELIIEAASQEAVREYGLDVIRSGKNLLLLSSGALVDKAFLEEMLTEARERHVKVHIPSGPLFGVDGIKAAALAGLSEVTLEYRRNPRYIQNHLNASQRKLSAKKALLIYEGPASEAAPMFPKHLNISATLGLAGLGPEMTRVRVLVDPNVKIGLLRIHTKSQVSEAFVEWRNLAKTRAKGKYSPVASALRKIRDLGEPISIGT